ncbi:MAG: NAD(+) diphosphatase [Chlamydiae bacterium]|nr:NAD(+) diphosphatase [Chlamydiota bacterium]
MILPPFAAPIGFKDSLLPPASGETLWFIFSKDQLLIAEDRKTLPFHHNFSLQRTLYLGTLRNKHLFTGEVDSQDKAPSGWLWTSLRLLHTLLDEENYAVAGRALQLIHWDRTNQFCGFCGNITFSRQNERCRECKSCGQLAYPKLMPAIMALVKKDEKILLARSPHFPQNVYSVLAGFVDPGETLEQCVAREVLEEVGIKVKNVRYFGSQPWPFSYSLMVGFTCEWLAGEIKIDSCEIEDAAWFDSFHLPQLPQPLSLAYILIDAQLNRKN